MHNISPQMPPPVAWMIFHWRPESNTLHYGVSAASALVRAVGEGGQYYSMHVKGIKEKTYIFVKIISKPFQILRITELN